MHNCGLLSRKFIVSLSGSQDNQGVVTPCHWHDQIPETFARIPLQLSLYLGKSAEDKPKHLCWEELNLTSIVLAYWGHSSVHSSNSYSACSVYLEPNRQKSLPQEAYIPVSGDRQQTIKLISRGSQRKPRKFISPWLFIILYI